MKPIGRVPQVRVRSLHANLGTRFKHSVPTRDLQGIGSYQGTPSGVPLSILFRTALAAVFVMAWTAPEGNGNNVNVKPCPHGATAVSPLQPALYSANKSPPPLFLAR